MQWFDWVMKNKLLLLMGLLAGFSAFSQMWQDYSFSIYGQGSALSNYRTIEVQNKAYFSGGLDFGTSVSNSLNLKFGLHFIETYLNNDKQIHSICEQPDQSCFAESNVKYINFPIGIELYSNSSRLESKSYYNFRLIPMFSSQEIVIKSEIFSEPEFYLDVDSSLNSKFKFQDLHFEFSIGADISITKTLKFYFEPSVQHSILFRKEDLVNPNYMISLRIGLRTRHSKK